MKVSAIETLHADAGWRNFSFCKITTDDGLVGWSEYQEGFGSPGVSAAIDSLSALVAGSDPMATERTFWTLYAAIRPAAAGVAAQAVAAIENALLDVKAKALGVPAHVLLGGAMRERIRVYWSHCATYRVALAEMHGEEPVRSLDDIRRVGQEVRARGFTALKTNLFRFDLSPALWAPGFNMPPGEFDLNVDAPLLRALRAQMEAFRDGAGEDMDILLDLNFNVRTEGLLKILRSLDDLGLFWVEIDSGDAQGLALARQKADTPIAGGETLFGLRGFRPFLDARSYDVPIIDAVWNGVAQSMKIAAAAEAYETNIAPHNFYGHLSTMMNAHFVAALPNLRIMEIDIDQVPWRDALFTHAPEIVDGHLILPDRPGWGTEPDEDAVRAHPPKGGAMMRLEE